LTFGGTKFTNFPDNQLTTAYGVAHETNYASDLLTYSVSQKKSPLKGS